MSVALMFSGQGAQTVGMGRSLVENSPAARNVFSEAQAILGWDLPGVMLDGPQEKLTQTSVCQPALYVHGMALLATLQEQGRMPPVRAMLGLSLGELTACAAATVYDFETGLKLVAERGRLMQQACEATDGTMVSLIGGSEADAREVAQAHAVDVANLNGPGQTVLSGERAAIEAATEAAQASGNFKRVVPLNVAGAYHSRLMQPAKEAFAAVVEAAVFHKPAAVVFNNALGFPACQPGELKRALVEQVTATVRWEECMRRAAGMGIRQFYELGPGGVLAGLAKRIDRGLQVTSLAEWADIEAL